MTGAAHLTTCALSLAMITAAAPTAHADDPTAAAAAFKQAEDLVKQNQWEQACPLYEASYRADQQVGVLLHLADCHEHIHKLATAAAEFGTAAELAHRKGDNREAYAQSRADALAPKLAHLHLAPPAAPPPGLEVRRDGTDITVLVGTDMAIDAGDHEITANAPGRIEWRTKLTIGALPTTTQLAIPPLEVAPTQPTTAPPTPEVHDGSLRVTTQADAHIFLEGREVGVGSYAQPIHPGGYTLRVVAPGMRPYQAELTIGDGEQRAIDVPLEHEVVIAPPLALDTGPSFLLTADLTPGVKLHGDHPTVVAYRLDLGFRIGRRIDFGAYVEAGSIDANSGLGACGTSMPGSIPSSSFDFGIHNQFTRCAYVTPGLALYGHVSPAGKLDPWFGLAPGFRFGFYRWLPEGSTIALSEMFPGIVVDVRVGIDYHPLAKPLWVIGALLSAEVTAYGQEASSGGGATYVSLFGGVKTAVQF